MQIIAYFKRKKAKNQGVTNNSGHLAGYPVTTAIMAVRENKKKLII